MDPLWVEVIGLDHDATARSAHTGVGAIIGENKDFTEAAGWADSHRVVYLHQHGFHALIEVNAIAGRVEHAARFHTATGIIFNDGSSAGTRPPLPMMVAAGSGLPLELTDDGRRTDLGGGQSWYYWLHQGGTRITLPLTEDCITNIHCRSAIGEDEDCL